MKYIVKVLYSLFSNAFLHAREPSVIHVGTVHDGVYAAISVTDEGQGVSPEQLPYLFQKYTGLGPPRGVGLDLTICRGVGRNPRGPHPSRGRRTRTTHPAHLHDSSDQGGRNWCKKVRGFRSGWLAKPSSRSGMFLEAVSIGEFGC